VGISGGAINTLRVPEPWDIGDFQDVIDHLKADGYYLFQGEFVDPLSLEDPHPQSPEC